MAEQLGDRVKHYFTINEFASFVEQGDQGADLKVGGKILHFLPCPCCSRPYAPPHANALFRISRRLEEYVAEMTASETRSRLWCESSTADLKQMQRVLLRRWSLR